VPEIVSRLLTSRNAPAAISLESARTGIVGWCVLGPAVALEKGVIGLVAVIFELGGRPRAPAVASHSLPALGALGT